MAKNLYIDASHPNETRVVLKSNGNIEDYEYEGIKNSLIKNGRKEKILYNTLALFLMSMRRWLLLKLF